MYWGFRELQKKFHSNRLATIWRNAHSTNHVGFLVVLCDVCVFVETKHLWVGYQRQATHIVNVCLIHALNRGVINTTL